MGKRYIIYYYIYNIYIIYIVNFCSYILKVLMRKLYSVFCIQDIPVFE